MNPLMHRRGFVSLVAAAAAAAAPSLHAQDAWAPTRPVSLVVPFAPGGPTDAIARAVAERLGKALGQPMVVENRPGAGGAIAYEHVARAAPDGHTIGMLGSSMVANAALGILQLDPLRNFTPIAQLFNLEILLVVRPEVPANSVGELIRYLKAHPGRLNYGSSGNGSLTHLQMEVFKSLTGTSIVHIPYKGSSGTVQDLLAGQIQLSFDTVATFGPHIKSGALRLLAVAMPTRSSMFPDTPLLVDSDPLLKDFDLAVWAGLGGPAGLPKPIVARIHQEVGNALKDDALVQRLHAAGAAPAPSSTEAFVQRMGNESVKLTRLIRQINLKVG
ncbi:Bug family tripartite tricarboxylate transporter substrate binding protein [Pseudorhodoferax sp.]|uniref:Bug family tripartite tricarboxylate transporter substrate binding protein n=1 Tax=Pseudorhodoferax sp. TaxID=1993553 RepID=UPI002DD64DB2|nr:tripartite tricarboxylate transporter substrate binding protein [Pseudorhodoferax sp.]